MMGKKLIPIFFIMAILVGGVFVIVGSPAYAGCCACGMSGKCTPPGVGGCPSCAAPKLAEDPTVKEKIKDVGETFAASTGTLTERLATYVRGTGSKFALKMHDAGEKSLNFGCPESDDKIKIHGNIVFALADTQ